jgi:hypothetical protein
MSTRGLAIAAAHRRRRWAPARPSRGLDPERTDAQPARLGGPLSTAETNWLRTRNDRIVRALVAAYLVVLGILGCIWGIRLTPDVALVAVVLVVAIGLPRWLAPRGWPVLQAWSPFLVLAMAYELIRGFGPAVISRVNIDDIPALERVLFGGRLATELLQAALRPLSGFDPLAAIATIIYLAHTPLPLVVGAYLWFRYRRLFYDFLAALVVLSLLAFATYLVYPAAPPWWAAAVGHLSGAGGEPLVAYLKPGAFDGLVSSAGIDSRALFSLTFSDISPDPVAAFPSLHAAYPLLAFLVLRRIGGPVAWAMLGYTVVAWFSIVYLGDHYVVDILGAVAYVALVHRLLPLSYRLGWLPGPPVQATLDGPPSRAEPCVAGAP